MSSLSVEGAVTLTTERLVMPRQMARDIKEHARVSAEWEACGLIAGQVVGREVHATQMATVGNGAADPRHHFRIMPWDQYKLEAAFEEFGSKLVGCYHSHPNGPAGPSETDFASIPRELVSVLYSRPHDRLTAWRGTDQIDLVVQEA